MHGLVLLMILTAVGYATISNAPFTNERSAFAAPVSGLSMPAATTNAAVADNTMVRASTNNKTLPGATGMVAAPAQELAPDIQAFGAEPSPTEAAPPIVEQEDAIVREAAEPIPTVVPAYQVHTAVDGDSVYSISDLYGISPDYILANNAELAAGGFLSVGQSVIIPAGNGILHEVRYGETLSDIAARYDVDVAAITGFASNGIADANSLTETQVVFVPNATIIPAVPFEEEVVEETIEEEPTSESDESDDDEASEEETTDEDSDDSADDTIVGGGASSSSGLIWPLGGPVSSPYGSGHPLGIDIDGFHLSGAAVAASTSGTVIFAGGNACCSYGLYVVIMSDSGIETLYAHLNSIYVSQGEYVSQGQAIGVVGNTGYSTGVHLHFEVIDNGVRQNPLNYLP